MFYHKQTVALTHIVLIPELAIANNLSHYHPISLYNVSYKIIFKI